MALTKLKILAIVLLLVSVFFSGAAAVARRALAGEQATGQEKQGSKQISQKVTGSKADTQKLGRTDLYGDPLPPGALVRMGTVRLRHLPGGMSTAFSPAGNILATADGNALRLWDLASGKLLLQVKEDHEWWGPVLFSPDGKLLASACNESLYLLDAATGKRICRIPAMDRLLGFSPDSKLVAATSTGTEGRQGTVYLWHTLTGQPAFELRSQARAIYNVVFTSDGRTLITLGPSQPLVFDQVACHWDVATRTLRKTVVIHQPPVRRSLSLRLSPDGQTMALAYYSATEPVSLWDTDTGKKKGTLQGDGTAGQNLAFTRDSRTLATTWTTADATQGTVSLWDATTGTRLRRFSIPGRAPDSLQFSPDGTTLATDNFGPCVHLLDTTTDQSRWQREAHEGSWITLSFAPDSRTLVSGSDDGTIRVWATATGRQVRELPGHKKGVHAVAVLPDGQRLLSGGYDAVLRLQELQTGKELRRLLLDPASEKLARPAYNLHGLGLATDGRTAASFSYRSEEGPSPELFQVWDMASGHVLVRGSPRARVYFDSFSPDAELMAGYVATDKPVESDSPVVVVEEVATGRRVLTLPQPDNGRDGRCSPVFAPNGRMLATSTSRVRRGRDNAYYADRHAIHLWELLTGKERLTITNNDPGLQFQYTRLTFAPDGRTLATARQDHTLQLWDVATGQELLRLAGYEVDIAGQALAVAPDGKTLATGHVDSTILLWDLAPEAWRQKRRSGRLTAQELMAAWADLASPDTRKAHAAIWKLAAVPQQAVPLLRDRLHPASAVRPDRLQELLNDLKSGQSRHPEDALKQLNDLEEQAEPALQDALNGNPTAEQRRRIEALLTEPRVVRAPEKLRALRAVEVLERCNSPEARHVLETLAQGAPEARLTQATNAVLQRLGKTADLSR